MLKLGANLRFAVELRISVQGRLVRGNEMHAPIAVLFRMVNIIPCSAFT